jgi:hypothetical protein
MAGSRASHWLWIGLFAAAPAAAQGNLVINGSFEEPALGFGSWAVYSSIPGWTTTVGSGIEVENHAAGTPYAGNQLVEMDSFDNSGMQQSIPTVPGQSYVFAFEYSPRPGVPASSNGIEIRVNGNVIDTIAQDGTGNPDTVWRRFAYNVTATGASTTIEFRAVGTSDGVGGFLDAVGFTGPPAAVPALGRWQLLVLGMLLLAGALAVRRTRG